MNKKLKILIIHPFFTDSSEHFRGSELVAQSTYKMLKDAGHEVYFFSTDEKPYIDNKDWTKYFIKYHQRFNLSCIWNFEAQNKLNEMLDEIKPDIIHIHGLGRISYSVFPPIFKRKIPAVMTVHDTGIVCPTAKSWDDPKASYCTKCSGCNVLPCILNNCITTKKLISSFNVAIMNLFNKLTRYHSKIDRYITPSQILKKFISSEIPANKIDVVPNFISNSFDEIVPEYKNNASFLYAGSLRDYKGVQTLLEAVKLLPENINLIVAGSGPDEHKYKKYAYENHLKNVRFIGAVSQKEMIKLYNECIAVIVPSLYFEIFGLVVIEAFAAGKLVIASRLGGLAEIIEHGKNGLLVSPGNPIELSQAMKDLYNNYDKTVEMGKFAKKTSKSYSEKIYFEKTLKIYSEVLSDNNILK